MMSIKGDLFNWLSMRYSKNKSELSEDKDAIRELKQTDELLGASKFKEDFLSEEEADSLFKAISSSGPGKSDD